MTDYFVIQRRNKEPSNTRNRKQNIKIKIYYKIFINAKTKFKQNYNNNNYIDKIIVSYRQVFQKSVENATGNRKKRSKHYFNNE